MQHSSVSMLSVLALAGLAVILSTPPARAGSPWLPAPGAGNVSLSYTYQTADEYYRKTSPTSSVETVPLPDDLQQHTVLVDVEYGLFESVALDVRLGYAESYFQKHGTLREKSPGGLGDVNFGVTYRLLDETIVENELLPSLALRAGAIIAGDYDTGSINSLGDGGEGFEISGLAGKFFADRFALLLESLDTGCATRIFQTTSFYDCPAACCSGSAWGSASTTSASTPRGEAWTSDQASHPVYLPRTVFLR